jgi:hypothetical protein
MIRLLDRVITNGEALLRLRRDSGPGQILLFLDELSEAESSQMEARLNELRRESGSSMAKMVAAALAMIYVVFIAEGGSGLFPNYWGVAGVGFVFVLLAAIWGKVLGMRQADREFQETTAELAGLVSGGVLWKSTALAALALGRVENAGGFRLPEQQMGITTMASAARRQQIQELKP